MGRPKGSQTGRLNGEAKGETNGRGQRGRPKRRPNGVAIWGGQRVGHTGRPKGEVKVGG